MGLKVTNNAYGTLNASITSSSTTIVLVAGQGARFPTLSAGDYFYATLIDTSNNLEVVKVTARSTDTLTVVRGQDSTTARAYATNDRFELRPTAALFTEVIDTANAALPKAGGVMASGGRIQFQNSDGYTLYGIRGTRYGYSGSYRAIQIGNGTSSENISLGVDVSAIAGGAFTGNGKDIVVPNGAMFSMPNSGNTDFVVPLQFDTAGRVLNPIQPFVTPVTLVRLWLEVQKYRLPPGRPVGQDGTIVFIGLRLPSLGYITPPLILLVIHHSRLLANRVYMLMVR